MPEKRKKYIWNNCLTLKTILLNEKVFNAGNSQRFTFFRRKKLILITALCFIFNRG